MSTLLAGDIGGTKTLLSLHSTGDLSTLASERYPSADWDDLGTMLRHFLQSVDPARTLTPSAACLAVAGPVQGGRASLTNLPWQLSAAELAADTGIPQLELVNDFAVLIYGLPHLQGRQLAPIRDGTAVVGEPLLVLGAGTGLGIAMGIAGSEGLQAVASEAGHGEFAPRTAQEWKLKQWLQHDLQLERVSIERVVSGTGLGQVARWLLASRHPSGDHDLSGLAERWRLGAPSTHGERPDLPAAVAAAAAAGEPLACESLELWLSAYGSVTGDLALASLSRGGIWLAGGTAAKLIGGLRSAAFGSAFLAKGRLRAVLEDMPIQAVLDPAVGSFSAACRARMLVGCDTVPSDT